MMKIMANKQRGVSLSGLLITAAVLVLVGIGGMKLIPSYMQEKEIKHIFDSIVHDPEMQNATVRDIRMSFIKRAMISNVTVIKADDIEISKDGGGVSLSVSYSVKVPLAANASLLLEFNPSSSK